MNLFNVLHGVAQRGGFCDPEAAARRPVTPILQKLTRSLDEACTCPLSSMPRTVGMDGVA